MGLLKTGDNPLRTARGPARILLEGRPGVGKTTLARRLVKELRMGGVDVHGFTTEELREDGRRIGFAVETVDGERGVLAHSELPGPPRVGRYGVDVAVLERLAVPALDVPGGETGRGAPPVVVVDELGKMELASARFRTAVGELLDRPVSVVATVHTAAHPFTDGLKRRPGIELVRVTPGNRDRLPVELAQRLGVGKST